MAESPPAFIARVGGLHLRFFPPPDGRGPPWCAWVDVRHLAGLSTSSDALAEEDGENIERIHMSGPDGKMGLVLCHLVLLVDTFMSAIDTEGATPPALVREVTLAFRAVVERLGADEGDADMILFGLAVAELRAAAITRALATAGRAP